jgi:hypothetical protein
MVNWIGEVVGIALVSGGNPVPWITAFFFSKKPNRATQAILNGAINAACWLAILAAVDEKTPSPDQVAVGAFIAGAVILYLLVFARFLFVGGKTVARKSKMIAGSMDTRETVAKIKASAASTISSFKGFDPGGFDDQLFEQALEELESGSPKKSTWAKCLATSGGDTSKARAKYIEFRVKELSDKP